MKSIEPTSLDYAILGLINKEPLSGYQVRKEFETTALGNYSSSPGSIYPALKRLQNLGRVVRKSDSNNKKQKFYCTPSGKKLLREWFLKEIELRDITHGLDELLLRFAFMDNSITKDQKINFLSSLRDFIKNYIKGLQDYYESPVFGHQPLHGRLAFEHGLDSYKTTLKWCKNCITILNKTK